MSGRNLQIALAAVVVVALIVGYATHFAGAFVWDDKVYLLDNPRMAPGASFVVAVKTPLAGQVFRPVSTATLWAQIQLHGFSMTGLRAAQLALHLGCGTALFVFLRRHLHSVIGALIGAGVFLVHPAATEVVMFANARHDALGTLFALLAMVALDDGVSLRRGIVAGVATLLAIGCKESYVVLAPLLALQVLVSPARERLGRRLAIALGPTLVAMLVVFTLRRLLGVSAASALSVGPWPLSRAFASLLLRHVVAFVTFTDAPTAQRYVPPGPAVTLSVLAIALGSIAFLVHRWRGRRGEVGPGVALFGASLLMLGLLPSVAAIPATGQHGNRYGYFALVGFAILVACLAVPVAAWVRGRSPLLRRVAIGSAIAAALMSALETAARAGDWHDGLSLFGADVERIPDDSRANYHFGVEVVAARGCEQALPYFVRATQNEPDWPRPFRNVAGCELRLHRPAEALAPARRAVELEPLEAAHRRNLVAALLGVGRLDEARAELLEAERLAPGAPQNEALRKAFPP